MCLHGNTRVDAPGRGGLDWDRQEVALLVGSCRKPACTGEGLDVKRQHVGSSICGHQHQSTHGGWQGAWHVGELSEGGWEAFPAHAVTVGNKRTSRAALGALWSLENSTEVEEGTDAAGRVSPRSLSPCPCHLSSSFFQVLAWASFPIWGAARRKGLPSPEIDAVLRGSPCPA